MELSLVNVILGCVVVKVTWQLWKFMSLYMFGSFPNFKKYGDWSVVTGATAGIGLAFAQKLAEKKQNIVLISRSEEKLKAVSADIEKDYGVSTKVIVADFASTDIYEKVAAELTGLNIGTLINNVGVSYDYPEYFLDSCKQTGFVEKLMNVNMMSVVKMTEIILPCMVEKKKGLVLNISSSSALQPTPLLSLYSAAKQFVDCFSRSLHTEYRSKGIIIQSVLPMYVTTKLSGIRRSSFFVPTPQSYVRSALRGVERGARTCGYFAHGIQGMVIEMVPEWLFAQGAVRLNGSIRIRALKRRENKDRKSE